MYLLIVVVVGEVDMWTKERISKHYRTYGGIKSFVSYIWRVNSTRKSPLICEQIVEKKIDSGNLKKSKNIH